jgi:hypothetical protein
MGSGLDDLNIEDKPTGLRTIRPVVNHGQEYRKELEDQSLALIDPPGLGWWDDHR